MIKAIIFDCFGVLYPQAVGKFLKKHEMLFKSDTAFLGQLDIDIDLGKITRANFFKKIEAKIGIPVNQLQNEIDQQMIPDLKLVELIKNLKEKYKIGLLSNAGEEEIHVLYRDHLDYLFDSITVSYEAQLIKPNPEIFTLCSKRLEIPLNECLFIDYVEVNIEAARLLGMHTLLYEGYDKLIRDLKLTDEGYN